MENKKENQEDINQEDINQEDLVVDYTELLDCINNFAHRSKIVDAPKETLQEHTERTVHYYRTLIAKKNLNVIFAHFEKVFFSGCSPECLFLFRKLVINVAVFHDFGKIEYSNAIVHRFC